MLRCKLLFAVEWLLWEFGGLTTEWARLVADLAGALLV